MKAWHRLGKVPGAAVKEIEAKAAFDVARVNEIEQTTNHDVIAFLTNVAEYVGDASKYVHYGMTSSDMLDTALALQIKRAGQLLERSLHHTRRGAQAARARVPRHRGGRPYPWHPRRAHDVRHEAGHLAVGGRRAPRAHARATSALRRQISGAVGTSTTRPGRGGPSARSWGSARAHHDQVVQRDRHAEFLTTLAIVGSSWRSSPPRSGTFSAPRSAKRRSRSARARRAPRPCRTSATPPREHMAGCARVLRGNALVGMENVALWHERDTATARPSAWCCPTAPSCSTTCCRSSRGWSTTSSSTRSACWRTWLELPPRLQRGGPAGPGQRGHAA